MKSSKIAYRILMTLSITGIVCGLAVMVADPVTGFIIAAGNLITLFLNHA